VLTAVIRVTGTGRLEEFGERVRWLMVHDAEASRAEYTEHHAEGVLEYRFATREGIPFPAFAAASEAFPELRVEAAWENAAQGVRGEAVIENGRPLEQHTLPLEEGALGIEVEAGEHGELVIAMACARRGGAWIGYCVDAARHAYFITEGAELRLAADAGARWTQCVEGDRAVPLDEAIDDALLSELEDVAFRFAGDWLWFDAAPASETALERKRYADHGWPVQAANLKAERVLALGPGRRFGAISSDARPLLGQLRRAWQAIQ